MTRPQTFARGIWKAAKENDFTYGEMIEALAICIRQIAGQVEETPEAIILQLSQQIRRSEPTRLPKTPPDPEEPLPPCPNPANPPKPA